MSTDATEELNAARRAASHLSSQANESGRHNRHALRGYIYIAAAALLWGVAASLGRAAFTGRLFPGKVLPPIDPLILSQTRTTLSFLVLLPVLLLRGRWSRLRMPPADLARTFVLGVLGAAGSNYFYYLGIQKTNVATAVVLQYTAPIWVLLYGIARKIQKPTLQRIAAVALATSGIPLLVGAFASGGLRLDPTGVLASFLAAFAFAFYNIGGHNIVARYWRWTVLFYVLMSAALFWGILNPPWKLLSAHFSREQWLFLAVFAMVSVLAPFSFYLAGLQYLDPTKAIIVSCLEPVFTILIAAIALGETLSLLQMLGGALVLSAVLVVQLPDRKTHEPGAIVEPIE
jgi:drug/metabolite transporter (DMT)-like permease